VFFSPRILIIVCVRACICCACTNTTTVGTAVPYSVTDTADKLMSVGKHTMRFSMSVREYDLKNDTSVCEKSHVTCASLDHARQQTRKLLVSLPAVAGLLPCMWARVCVTHAPLEHVYLVHAWNTCECMCVCMYVCKCTYIYIYICMYQIKHAQVPCFFLCHKHMAEALASFFWLRGVMNHDVSKI
jgi:hypothetical protein